jgi:Tol biopolymer transport system component
METDGKNPVQLTKSDNGMNLRPQILKDGRTIVFERGSEERNKSKLIKISIDGDEGEILFPESPMNDAFPNLSKDGKYLAFTSQSFNRQNLEFKNLFKLSGVKENNIGKIEKEIDMDLGWNYRWSPDNKAITFLGQQGVPNLFNAPLSTPGSSPKQLTNFNSGVILNFDWSRDGKRLIIVRGIINSDLILIKDNAKTT